MNAPTTTQQITPDKVKTIADLGSFLGTRMKQIKSVIASNLTPEKMARISLNELRNNDYLAKIAIQNPESFVNAVVQASHLGLEIGGVLGQAYLVPYKGEIKMMPGYRGLISLARRSGEITSINAEIVYANDTFDLSLGVAPAVVHKPMLDGDRGEPKLAYMVANFKDGGHHFEWMTIAEVMSIKARSSAVQSGKKTPWDTDRDEMIRKTVIRRGWKYLPMSIEMQTAQLIETANDLGKNVVIDGDAVLVQDDPDAPDAHAEAKQPYSQADFEKNLPGWKKAIADGKRTADQVIAMANSKAPLTEQQIATIRNSTSASAEASSAQAGNGGAGAAALNPAAVTFAQVEASLLKSKDLDVLSVAADLIGEVSDPAQRTELAAIYNKRKEELES